MISVRVLVASGLAVAGVAGAARGQGAFAGLGVLEQGGSSSASGVSADGLVVVGEATINGSWRRAVRWTAGTGLVNIDPDAPQYTTSRALGVSATGGIVTGYRIDSNYDSVAFRWTSGAGLMLLPDVPGGIGGGAGGVSDDGQVTAGEGAETFSNGGGLPARWTAAGDVSQLPVFEDTYSGEALHVSADGRVIVGFADHAHLEEPPYTYEQEACRWVDGTIQGLGRLPGAEAPITRAVHASTDEIGRA